MDTIILCIKSGGDDLCIGEECPLFERCWDPGLLLQRVGEFIEQREDDIP